MLKGEFGFLCMSVCLESKYVKIYEKAGWTREKYKEFLEKTGGVIPENGRAPQRIYDCPRNYSIEGDFLSQDHIDFFVSCLGLIFGVKLVSKKFSYVDNTNIIPLHIGFVEFSKKDYILLLDRIFLFYKNHSKTEYDKIEIIKNAIYIFFRAETKDNFPYETFFLLYTGVDCCYKYFEKDKPGPLLFCHIYVGKSVLTVMTI